MIVRKKGIVRRLLVDREDYQEAEIIFHEEKGHDKGASAAKTRGGRAVNYPPLTGKIKEGDEVLVNTTAVELGLGTGGKHFVICNLTSGGCRHEDAGIRGHMMKMRYAPLQVAVQTCEEPSSPYHQLFQEKLRLEGQPVVLCELHSMVPVFVKALKKWQPDVRIAYLMTDGGALPLSWSEHIRLLSEEQDLAGTVTCGHAFGGQIEAVNEYTGLLAAKHLLNADVTIVAMGPGIAGTGTPYGFSGIEQGEMVNRVAILGGIPVFVPRISFRDPRKRHYGVSHHSLTALRKIALRPAFVPLPVFADERDELIRGQLSASARFHRIVEIPAEPVARIKVWLSHYPKTITTMGRTIDEDPEFFQTVAAAARFTFLCLRRLRKKGESSDPAGLSP
ncbi:DUF3866 family protein [Bacillaceae bacterium]